MNIIKFLFGRGGNNKSAVDTDKSEDRPVLALYPDGRLIYNELEFRQLHINTMGKLEAILLKLLQLVYIRNYAFNKELEYQAQAKADVKAFLDYVSQEQLKKMSADIGGNPNRIIRPGGGRRG